MTLSEARKKLPAFACGLGIYAKSTAELRDFVQSELTAEQEDHENNPLEPKQIAALKKFLKVTA